jgi:hypothetical protein
MTGERNAKTFTTNSTEPLNEQANPDFTLTRYERDPSNINGPVVKSPSFRGVELSFNGFFCRRQRARRASLVKPFRPA